MDHDKQDWQRVDGGGGGRGAPGSIWRVMMLLTHCRPDANQSINQSIVIWWAPKDTGENLPETLESITFHLSHRLTHRCTNHMHMHTHMCTHTHTHLRTHPHTHTHTQSHWYSYVFILFGLQCWSHCLPLFHMPKHVGIRLQCHGKKKNE